MKYSISAYMFRVRGEANCYSLQSQNPEDAWEESKEFYGKQEIILFERQSIGIIGENNIDVSIYYHVPIYHGYNKNPLPKVIKRCGNKKTAPLQLKDITNIKI